METSKKTYDLEDRTLEFARNTRYFIKFLPRTAANFEDQSQLIRSSGSIGANYIEANEALGKKDFILRLRIARKEAREAHFWFKLIDTGNNRELDRTRDVLIQECKELISILSAIINKAL